MLDIPKSVLLKMETPGNRIINHPQLLKAQGPYLLGAVKVGIECQNALLFVSLYSFIPYLFTPRFNR